MKKRVRVSGQTGIGIRSDGIAVARSVPAGDDTPPRLTLCRFLPATEGEHPAMLRQLSRELSLGSSHCISVAAQNSFSLLLVEAPEVDPTELKAAVRWRIKDLIDFHTDDAVIDVFDIPGQRERGRPKLMYVVASRITSVQQHIDLLEECEVNLKVIDIPELALRNIAALLPEDKGGVATLYIGRDSGLLILTRNKNLYLARRLELGMTQLLRYAESGRGEDELVLDEVAEMSQPLQRALDSIVLEVQRSLDYYESHFSMPAVGGLVLAPMEVSLPGMMGYLSANLGVPVRMLDLNALIETEQPLPDQLQARCLLAIGAALRHEAKAL